MSTSRNPSIPVIGWLAAAALIGSLFYLMSQRHETAKLREPTEDLAELPREQNIAAAGLPAPLEQANDGIPFMPANPHAPLPAGPVHPHPITPEHQRIFEENRILGALNGAMDASDAATLRKLLAQYEEQYPEDAQDVQGGYAIIADCLENPNQEARAIAQRWSDEHHGSTVRRFVNRRCLEN